MRRFKNWLVFLPVVVFVGCGSENGDGTASDDPDGNPSGGPASAELTLTAEILPLAAPMLAIQGPWKEHQDASLEIVLSPTDGPDVSSVQPIYFMPDNAKGLELAKRLGIHGNDSLNFSTDYGEFTARGLKMPSSGETAYYATAMLIHQNQALPWAVFPRANQWDDQKGGLRVRLPGEGFEQPGTLRAWLLTGRGIRAEGTLDWPGQELPLPRRR